MSFLNSIINTIVRLVQVVRGKNKTSDIVLAIVAELPAAIVNAIAIGKLDTVGKLEEALAELDFRTGLDGGAIDVIKDLPADKEEELFDAIKTVIDILAKNKLKVDGYHV